jgi:hypothetical protein
VRMSFEKLKPICFGTTPKIRYLQFVKERNCEIYVDVGFRLIFFKGQSDIYGKDYVGLLC